MARYIEGNLTQYPWCPKDRPELERYIEKIDDEGIVWIIPNDPGNKDFMEYEEWLAAGNQPEPYEERVAPEVSE